MTWMRQWRDSVLADRRGAGATSILLMIAALASMVLFLYYLNIESAPYDVQIVEEDSVDTMMGPTAVETQFSVYATDPSAYVGRLITIPDVAVTSQVGGDSRGSGIFWASNEGTLVLFYLTQAVKDAATDFASGAVVTVTGHAYALSDSAFTAWVDAGRAMSDDEIEVTFADYFFEVEDIEGVGGGMGGAPAGGGGGDAGAGGSAGGPGGG